MMHKTTILLFTAIFLLLGSLANAQLSHKDIGNQMTKGEWEATDTHYIASGSTGDILYLDASNILQALNIGASGYCLMSNGTLPLWQQVDFSDLSGTIADGQIPASIARDTELHDEVTVTGETYASLTGQQITFDVINLASQVTGTLDEGNIDSDIARDTEITSDISTHASDADAHQDLVTLAGTPDYLTIVNQVITRNLIDLANDVTGTLPEENIHADIMRDSEFVPAGSDSHIQYNDGGSFGGDSNLTWNDVTSILTVGSTSIDAAGFITHTGSLTVDGDSTFDGSFNIDDDENNPLIDVDGVGGKIMLGKNHSDHDFGISANQVVHYDMNDNAASTTVDDLEETSDGTLAGGDNTEDINVAGQIKGGLYTDGTSDYIDAGSPFNSTFDGNFTIAYWVYIPDGMPTSGEVICGLNDSEGGDNNVGKVVMVLGTDGRIQAQYFGLSASYGSAAQSLYPVFADGDNGWNHVVWLFDDSTGSTLYLNGSALELDGTNDGSLHASDDPSAFNSAHNFYIGGRNGNGSLEYAFEGGFDDFRIFNRKLTAAEIVTLASGTEEDSISYEVDITGDAFISGALHSANILQASDPSLKEFKEKPDLSAGWDQMKNSTAAFEIKELRDGQTYIGVDASKLPDNLTHNIAGKEYVNIMGLVATLIEKTENQEQQIKSLQSQIDSLKSQK